MQPWIDENRLIGERDPDFAAAWQATHVKFGMENLDESSSFEIPPWFPHSPVMLSGYLEFKRNKPPAPEPQKYVFTHPRDARHAPGVVGTGNHAEYEGDGWFRMTLEAAAAAGVVNENWEACEVTVNVAEEGVRGSREQEVDDSGA